MSFQKLLILSESATSGASRLTKIAHGAIKFPTTNGEVKDDSRYPDDDLRPGVRLGGLSSDGVSRLITTSGVCVEAPDGTKSITVAKHGFLGSGNSQGVY